MGEVRYYGNMDMTAPLIKRIEFKFSDGKTYWLDPNFMAESRAKYYADNDNPGQGPADEEWRKTYEEEFFITLTQEDELHDWFRNNTDWADIESRMVFHHYSPPETSPYEEEFSNGEMDFEYVTEGS